MNLPEHTWIETADRLPALADAIAAAPWTALDTEANSMFVYREQVCLLQLNVAGALYVVDTLAIARAGGSIAALKQALEDPARTIWLHGGEYDVGTLKRDYGITLTGVWDSQQAASLLGWERTGYGSVVEKLCGVALDKAYTHYDWGTRPIEHGALHYAIDDVVYLPWVCEALRAEVKAADLEDEVAIANLAVEATGWSGGFDPAGVWKIKGIREVPRHHLPLLFALYLWRDGLAREANQPPGRLLNNELMLALVRNAPTNFQLLKKLGLRGWFLSAHGEPLLDAIKAALSNPPTMPERPRQREVLPEEELRETRLKDWRRSEADNRTKAEGRPVPLQVVLPAKALEYLKQHGGNELSVVPQLGTKRSTRYGAKLQELCRV
ncbi:MAG: HRDC domain-containing protein [Planctomycetes bacterium]|nr:HRDC domain-containing protein [Planctomycetota bacterium]